MTVQSFDPDIASRVGINAAVAYQGISSLCEHNAANGENRHDGLHWTRASVESLARTFRYLTAKQVRTAVDRLVDAGLVKVGDYGEPCDRTKWYAVAGPARF